MTTLYILYYTPDDSPSMVTAFSTNNAVIQNFIFGILKYTLKFLRFFQLLKLDQVVSTINYLVDNFSEHFEIKL